MTDDEAAAFATALLDMGASTAVTQVLLERGADAMEADPEPWAQPRYWTEKMRHSEIAARFRDAQRRYTDLH